MTALAHHVGIEDPYNFGSEKGNLRITDSIDDLISFLDMVNSNKNFS